MTELEFKSKSPEFKSKASLKSGLIFGPENFGMLRRSQKKRKKKDRKRSNRCINGKGNTIRIPVLQMKNLRQQEVLCPRAAKNDRG